MVCTERLKQYTDERREIAESDGKKEKKREKGEKRKEKERKRNTAEEARL